MPYTEDTIYALATPPGRSGVAVVRVSGSRALPALKKVFSSYGGGLEPRRLHFGELMLDGAARDQCMAVYFQAPASYTGEDAAELHLHGSPFAVRAAYQALEGCGLRLAEPGEFTKRAFLNGKMDLSRAEAVMDFIAASGELGAKAALRQMKGKLSEAVDGYKEQLLDATAGLEASIDFPEEDIEEQTLDEVAGVLQGVVEGLDKLIADAGMGEVLRDGVRVVLAGRPNVGKSSLLNAILGRERVIVTDVPGTTRDTLEEAYSYKGLALRFLDTAGIRATQDRVEKLGVARAAEAAEQADMVLLVVDGAAGLCEEDRAVYRRLSGRRMLVVVNKADLPGCISARAAEAAFAGCEALRVSAKRGDGIDALLERIFAAFAAEGILSEDALTANQRQISLLADARRSAAEALASARRGLEPELVSIDVRDAWRSLCLITGQAVDEDVINRIFERFCLGK